MNVSGVIIWKNKEIGRITDITTDMWYLDASWYSTKCEVALEFEKFAIKLNAEDVIKTPTKGIVVVLRYDDAPSDNITYLVLSVNGSKIYMRLISEEVAAYADFKLLEPWQETDRPTFYESELKKEVSFFHPLNWKRVKAIGNRTDRDEVLFEILNGKFKYAVVHLTWRKESSLTFPVTKFYKDWEDLFQNRILEDHNEWSEG